MRIVRELGLIVLVMVVCASGAAAQETHKVGVTMGAPLSVGMIFHVSDKVAIRPEFRIQGTSSDTESTTGTDIEGDSTQFATGVSALFYLQTFDRVRTYLSPRISYSHVESTTTSSGSIFGPSQTTAEGSAWSGSGSFGAEGSVADRFAVFGEFGFDYTHSSTKTSTSSIRPESNSWGTRAGVGVIFYF